MAILDFILAGVMGVADKRFGACPAFVILEPKACRAQLVCARVRHDELVGARARHPELVWPFPSS